MSFIRLRILIVEDEVIIALLLAEVLSEMGHEVCATEATQPAAIAAALRCRPDLMIIDEHLRQGSGLGVADAVLAHRPTPHVFVSGHAAPIRKARPDAIVLEKPYFEADLARAIDKAMNQGSGVALGPAPMATRLRGAAC